MQTPVTHDSRMFNFGLGGRSVPGGSGELQCGFDQNILFARPDGSASPTDLGSLLSRYCFLGKCLCQVGDYGLLTFVDNMYIMSSVDAELPSPSLCPTGQESLMSQGDE